MQADKPRFKKRPTTYFTNSVVIGLGNNKTRKAEKEIHRQETVRYKILAVIRIVPLHKMEGDDRQGSYAAQAI